MEFFFKDFWLFYLYIFSFRFRDDRQALEMKEEQSGKKKYSTSNNHQLLK